MKRSGSNTHTHTRKRAYTGDERATARTHTRKQASNCHVFLWIRARCAGMYTHIYMYFACDVYIAELKRMHEEQWLGVIDVDYL